MIRSMTGYGLGASDAPGLKITVELRSVNNRFADLKLRLPDGLSSLEPDLRRAILAVVKRGRVDVDVRIERSGAGRAELVLNRSVVESALAAWRTLRDEFGIHGPWDLAAMMRVPGVFEVAASATGLDESGRVRLEGAMAQALDALDADRRREGEGLALDLRRRVARMREIVAAIRERASEVPAVLSRKLAERVAQLASQTSLDPARLAQEAAFLADRCDVTEETVRLQGHLDHATALLSGDEQEPIGKRLEFLLQEIQRETNTIASKSADLGINRQSLELKAESEKIREQVLNLE